MATKYPKTAKTGDTGIALVQSIVTDGGAIYRPFPSADIGIDGLIELLWDNGEPTGDVVLVQVKSGSSYVKNGKFYVTGDKDHFETWARYGVPVIGIVCDKGQARWVDISQHLQKNPEVIDGGPYSILADQPFSVAEFPKFLGKFRRKPGTATTIKATPNLLIRPWQLTDAVPTRALLAPIALDYPDFYDWLARKFSDPNASKKVVVVDNSVAAFSMWQRKDDRNIKLQTFIVGSRFRGTGIGQHLLYHELRTWAEDEKIERVHVTVASNKSELVEYFHYFGFKVEGIAANRYPRPTAELVLTKHFLRGTVHTPKDLENLSNYLCRQIWGLGNSPDTRFGVTTKLFAVPAIFPELKQEIDKNEKTVTRRIALVGKNGEEIIRHDDESIMREFYPLRIHLAEKRYILIPIYPKWAEAMLSTSGPHTPLKLRIDHVYYCYPKVTDLKQGDLVVFYETGSGGGRKAAIGCAVVQRVVIDTPSTLYGQFSHLGIYELSDIEGHENNSGKVMAIKFALYEDFNSPVPLKKINTYLGHDTRPQGLTPISRDGFEKIRNEGLK